MTEFEYHELITSIGSMITELTALFISVFVAYLVCSYVVGSKLSRFQYLAITFTYSIFVLLMIFIVYSNLVRSDRLTASYFQLETATASPVFLTGPIVMGLAWVISLVFMLQIRRSSDSGPRDDDT